MSYHLREVAGVKSDLADHYETIQRGGQPAAALRMLSAYHETTERLCDWPHSGRGFETEATDPPELQGIRVCGLPAPFQAFQVFYLPEPEQETIRILAVLHAAMGPQRRQEMLTSRDPTSL